MKLSVARLSSLLAVGLLATACGKLPGVPGTDAVRGAAGGSSGDDAPAPLPRPVITPTPTVSDEEPYEIRRLAAAARTLEEYAADMHRENIGKQVPQVEDLLADARRKYPDRDYAPYDKLLADVKAAQDARDAALAAEQNSARRWSMMEDEFDAALRATENGEVRAMAPGDAAALADHLSRLAARCAEEKLAALSDDARTTCGRVAGPHRFAQVAADEAMAKLTTRLDKIRDYKLTQASQGELWFSDGSLDYLDPVGLATPTLTAVDELVAVGAKADTAAARARAAELAAQLDDAVATGAKVDRAPKGAITGASITTSAEGHVGSEGKVIRAGVEKQGVAKVRNDFGVVTGLSGGGFVVYQPTGKTYCVLHAYSAGADASGKNWQLYQPDDKLVRVTRCK